MRDATLSKQIEAWANRHWPLLNRLRVIAGFAALFVGVAVYAWQTGVDRVVQALCGPVCLATPGFTSMADVVCGAAAILFVMLYTRLTLATQRVLLDPFKYVRPEPKPEAAATWAVAIHVILGFVVLFAMGAVGQMEIPHMVRVSSDKAEGMGLLLGWWIGGRIVLKFFWAKWRRGERFTLSVADER